MNSHRGGQRSPFYISDWEPSASSFHHCLCDFDRRREKGWGLILFSLCFFGRSSDDDGDGNASIGVGFPDRGSDRKAEPRGKTMRRRGAVHRLDVRELGEAVQDVEDSARRVGERGQEGFPATRASGSLDCPNFGFFFFFFWFVDSPLLRMETLD